MTLPAARAPQPSPGAFLELVHGYRLPMLIISLEALEICTVLDRGPAMADEVAAVCGLPPRAVRALLDACVAGGLLEKAGERYANATLADRFLVRGRPGYLGHSVRLAARLYRMWADLPRAVGAGRPVAEPPERLAVSDPAFFREFLLGLHEGALPLAERVAERLDLSGRTRLLDVGGRVGTYDIVLAGRYPDLEAVLFDLPDVLALAREVVAGAGLVDRITLRAGDYEADPFDGSYDVVLFSRVLRTESRAGARRLLEKGREALVPGGLVAIVEDLLEESRTAPAALAIQNLTMLLMFEDGALFSAAELRGLLGEAGFGEPSITRLSSITPYSLVVAQRV
ncbi:MAG: SAM-dependent methyltransferase [Deltaproteobacteria bacterium]|nr:SAM-dependent methyltransferase [Deltaproteobacteria bacterium]